MESIGVLMACPMNSYLEQQLENRFKLFRFWTVPDKSSFLASHKDSIQAVVGNAFAGADAKLIEALPKLEIVASFSVGLDKIDLAKCKEKGIRVTNTPDVLTEDVADLAIGLMLAVLRKLCESDRFVRSGKWKRGEYVLTTKVCWLFSLASLLSLGLLASLNTFRFYWFLCVDDFYDIGISVELFFLTVYPVPSFCRTRILCSYGCSLTYPANETQTVLEMSTEVKLVQKARALSYKSCNCGPHSNDNVPFLLFMSVVELAANCDILVVACALTTETHHIINREVIDALGPKGVLINIGRGPHVDEPELVSALVEHRLGGAGLDVFEHEPEVPEELFGLDNVVLLPHVGSGTVETRQAMADLVIGNLEAHFLKKPLLTPVV
ncbi:hypothetical protein Godav_008549 [Gossypium davidsonii]|uniref:Uncharacterized protein n=1 Tax=Gossypium davidsonii TaxID=34287 RepID=A0A7J8SAA4_GOSDV|nr:hypothetical protein [Gossypium davidsonii]